jgi:hypothetical protein
MADGAADQREAMYIVISKPKRRSSNAGCVHCMKVSFWLVACPHAATPGRRRVFAHGGGGHPGKSQIACHGAVLANLEG